MRKVNNDGVVCNQNLYPVEKSRVQSNQASLLSDTEFSYRSSLTN